MQKVSAAKIVRVVSDRMSEPEMINQITIFCAVYLGYFEMVALLIYSYFFYNVFVLFLSVLSGLLGRFIIHPLIHYFYKQERPNGARLIEAPSTPSFPSGHATFFFGVGFLHLYFNFPLGLILSLLALLIGIARVYAGVHKSEDIFGSAVVAIISSAVIFYYF